jgi:hypothetical protein
LKVMCGGRRRPPHAPGALARIDGAAASDARADVEGVDPLARRGVERRRRQRALVGHQHQYSPQTPCIVRAHRPRRATDRPVASLPQIHRPPLPRMSVRRSPAPIVSVLSFPEGLLSPFGSLRSVDGDIHLHLPVRSLGYTAMPACRTALVAATQPQPVGSAWRPRAAPRAVATPRSLRAACGRCWRRGRTSPGEGDG